jgi:hypothetical protein
MAPGIATIAQTEGESRFTTGGPARSRSRTARITWWIECLQLTVRQLPKC